MIVHSAAAASSTPLWQSISTVVNDCIRTAVILIAGLIGYARFVRGRVLHSSIAPSIKAEVVDINGNRAMKITAKIENSGSYRMTFPLKCWQNVKLDCADDNAWRRALTADEVVWNEQIAKPINLLHIGDITDAGETLEPGEEVKKCRLIPIPQGDWVAYRVILDIRSCAHMIWTTKEPRNWQTHQIILEQSNGAARPGEGQGVASTMGMS